MKEFLIGAAALAAVGPVLAQTAVAPQPTPQVQPVPRVAPMMDREITRDEVVARVREHFARLDTNRDGFLTREEADAGREQMRERIGERLKERGAERSAGAFDRLDANKDGVISRDEFNQAREVRIEKRIERRAEGEAQKPQMMRMHRIGGFGRLGGHMFDMADANKDGRVSLQEAQDAAVRHFDMADTNRDGRITREERRQMRQAQRAPRAD